MARKDHPVPTQALLRELFDYDPSGQLIPKAKRSNNSYAGKPVAYEGTNTIICVDGVCRPLPKLLWCWHYGEWPTRRIYPSDRDPFNTRIENLRFAGSTKGARTKIRSTDGLVTREEVLQLLDYDRDNGVFRWKRSHYKARASHIAGTDVNGYRNLTINGFHFRVHRIVWLVETGEWPVHEIDHRDGDPMNNRFSNLRLATSSQQKVNRRSHSKHGVKGVQEIPGRNKPFCVRLGTKKRGNLVQSRYFATLEEAKSWSDEMSVKLYGEFARLD